MLKRTHKIGAINSNMAGRTVVVNGWVDRIRNLGGIIFMWIRDRYGIVQVVFNPASEAYNEAEKIGAEYVLAVKGEVRERPQNARNPELSSGDIEIVAEKVEILAESKTPPIYVNREEGNEEMRLRYRYLDLRHPRLQENLIFRHKLVFETRKYLNSLDFLEIETPYLTKSTPEGARDFLVPSRIKKGNFYALPQSPQIFKQLLMIAGMDRYYQIARCFRDEDLRADRQPEFTQIDLEMSFVDEEDIRNVISGLITHLYGTLLGVEIGNIPVLTYEEVLEKYGSDKPDTRFEMTLKSIELEPNEKDLKFLTPLQDERLRYVVFPNAASLSRKVLDSYSQRAKEEGVRAGWVRRANGRLVGGISKILEQAEISLELKENEVAIVGVGKFPRVNEFLGEVRLEVAKLLNLTNDIVQILWVTDFPMFEWNDEEGRYQAQHHPFTMPYLEDLEEEDLSKIRAHSYDLVINGWELGSGSVRIHQKALQKRVFELIGLSEDEARKRFGFFLEAFDYGAPPHAGFAMGVDRLAAIMTNSRSLRDVIAFPKTTTGSDLMVGAPSEVPASQLKELGIKTEVDT